MEFTICKEWHIAPWMGTFDRNLGFKHQHFFIQCFSALVGSVSTLSLPTASLIAATRFRISGVMV